jgi:predicted  nucleic acid-binding Zn-ribbon protein
LGQFTQIGPTTLSASIRKNMIADTIQIRCPRCKSNFRDKARRIVNGYSRQCPSCESVMFFDEGSGNADIRRAVREAAAVRKTLREEEADKAARRVAASVEEADCEAPSRSRPSASRSVIRSRRS